VSVIELREVSKVWHDTVAVDGISFRVPKGSFCVLLGPSGCGKSTTLRMIAGLEEVTRGRVFIDGRDMTEAPPAARRVAMVFQSYALFPHLNVRENILFGLKVRRVPRPEREQRLLRVAKLVGLADLLDRKPAQLSGGQRQRVALARAIISEHPICLMDEPLSNLDAQLRHEMRVEIRALQERLGMTVVYVTHDQSEAMSMADRILLMRAGRIVQDGTPKELYERPAHLFVAAFIGTPPMNLLELADGRAGAVIRGTETPLLAGRGEGLVLGVRPEHLRLEEGEGLPVELIAADYLGADTIVMARIGDQRLAVRVPGHVRVRAGERARVRWPRGAMHLFDRTTGERLALPEAAEAEAAAS